MYCKNCGQELQNDVNFCGDCGTPTEAPAPVRESSVPVMKLRPVFVPWATWASIIPLHIFMTIWGAGFFGGFGMFAASALGLNLPPWATFVFFGLLFFFLIPIVTYVHNKKTYEKTEFTFYNTKLDYYEGFFTVERKTIDYRRITEVNLRRGIVQKNYNLGTIVLSTPATSAGGGRARSGIHIYDVPNADRVYEQVKGLIDRACSARAA